MLRTTSSVDKSLRFDPPNVIAVAGAPVDVLPDISKTYGEYESRTIQNIGANLVCYSFGVDCDGVLNVHGILGSGQTLNCTCQRLSMFSEDGTNVATSVLRRVDLAQHAQITQQ